jgi:hypothetical protein
MEIGILLLLKLNNNFDEIEDIYDDLCQACYTEYYERFKELINQLKMKVEVLKTNANN